MLKSPFEPCLPTRGTKVPDRPEWIHEIKHDGYRLIVQRDGKRVRRSHATAMTGATVIR
jgi:ATP-dependent DNA ligase